MLRRTTSLFRAAPGALTYVKGDPEKLTPQIIGFFNTDSMHKKVVAPEYVKVPFSLNAKTKDGHIAGSCYGHSVWGELHVDMIGTSPEVVVPGVGEVLMKALENLALKRSCIRVGLDTHSWQVRPFYERLGYNVFATHRNYPKGHEKYFLEKMLAKSGKVDPDLFALSGKSAAAAELEVIDGDEKEIVSRLIRWLDNDTQSRKIAGVPRYVKTEYGLEARLADGRLAAASCFETLWGEMHISLFGCHEEMKGLGIGGTFINHLFDFAREQGCYRVSLETMSWQAQPFYERHGFCVVGVQKELPTVDTTRIYLEKIL